MSTAVAFFGIRRAFGVAQLLTPGVIADLGTWLAHVEVARRENDLMGLGHLSCLVAPPA